jgi:hypothetical protein
MTCRSPYRPQRLRGPGAGKMAEKRVARAEIEDNPLRSFDTQKEQHFDFVAPGFDFVALGFEFVSPDLDIGAQNNG